MDRSGATPTQPETKAITRPRRRRQSGFWKANAGLRRGWHLGRQNVSAHAARNVKILSVETKSSPDSRLPSLRKSAPALPPGAEEDELDEQSAAPRQPSTTRRSAPRIQTFCVINSPHR